MHLLSQKQPYTGRIQISGRCPLRWPRLVVAVCVLFHFLLLADCLADNPAARAAIERANVLDAIFDSEILEDNFARRMEAAQALSPTARYESLAEWVIPGGSDSSFRLPMRFRFPKGETKTLAISTSARSIPLSAVIDLQCPAIELVRSASEAGKLSELGERIRTAPVTGAINERRQRTLLIMLDLASDDPELAQQKLATAFAHLKTLTGTELGVNCPETVAVFQGLQRLETRDICREILSYLVDSVIRVNRIVSQDPWDRGISAMAGWAHKRAAEFSPIAQSSSEFPFRQWTPVSRQTQRSLATGFPAALWVGKRGEVLNVCSHDEDYVYFQSPLQGDVAIECDVSPVQWQHSHLMVCGEWIAPVWGNSLVEVGSVQRLLSEIVIDPPISTLDGWIRYRTVMKDGVRYTSINGRLVQQQKLSENHDPWLAIRSPWYAEGGVRNLRITGQPNIPDVISLQPDAGLTQWVPGYDAVIGHDWDYLADPSGDQLVGVRRQSEASPTYRENLLQYHRPLMEDGTIEYEFFYQEGTTLVHPAVDDLAFLLSPDGVSLHHLTQGVYDRTDTDPALARHDAASRRGADRLTLKNADWNRLQLKMTGAVLQLWLNGELVFEKTLPLAMQRRFGFFHYADQTQAFVRRIQWRGEWPKTLPPESEQELADPWQSNEELPESQVFRHNFEEHGASEDLFAFIGFQPDGSSHQQTAEGLQVHCRGKSGCILCFVSPKVQVEGDFDLVAEFTRLKTVGDVDRSSGIFLGAVVNSTPITEASVFRGLIHNQNEAPRQLILSQVTSLKDTGTRMAWSPAISEEATSGRLQLKRRGNRIRCYFAEGDSTQFRLVSEEAFSPASLTADGIRLISMANESTGLTEVLWKNIEIRAAKLTGPSRILPEPDVDDLDKLRDKLPASFIHDFVTTSPDTPTYFRWRDTLPWDKDANGLKLTAEGATAWLTSGLNLKRSITGDFDIKVTFDELDLATPRSGAVSGLYVVIPVSDPRLSSATLHFRKLDDGRKVAVVGTGEVVAGQQTLTTIRTVDFQSVSALRVVRHKRTLTCLVSSPELENDRVVASFEFPDDQIPVRGLQIHLHTGGDGLSSTVLLKKLEIRATEMAEE